MHIQVNGEDREIAEGSSVSELLGALKLQAGRVAVEINLKIIDRGEFDRYVLHEDDRVEILSFIGGGSPSNLSNTGTGENQTVCAQSVSQTYQTLIHD